MNNSKIKLLEHTISVRFEESNVWEEGNMGRCSLSKCAITINKEMPHDSQGCVFVHELVHMIADMQGIELSEESVDGMALGVFSFIKNNQKFIVEELLDEAHVHHHRI